MKSKTAKCKQCGVKNNTEDTLFVNLKAFCDYTCATNFGKENITKGKKIQSKEYDDETKKLKTKFNSTDTKGQHKQTQSSFNKMRRLQELMWFQLQGKKPYCISCLKEDMDWCCGHFKTVGSSGHLRYDVKNTYLQCNRYCNMGLSGNIAGNKNTVGYKEGLKIRFGEAKAKEINEYCEKSEVKKWTGQELIDMRKKFNAEIRKIESILITNKC